MVPLLFQNEKYKNLLHRQLIERYTRFTVAPLVTENFPDIEEVDFIVVTGGGASLLAKEALKDEIGEEYFSRLLFLNESEFANVRGFYKGGYLKWHSSNEELAVEARREKPAELQESQTRDVIVPPIRNTETSMDRELLEAQQKLQALQSEIDGVQIELIHRCKI